MEEIKLKACPFCGSERVRFLYNLDLEPWAIGCNGCRCIINWPDIKVKGNKEPFGVVMGKMAEAWSRRPEDE